MVSARFVSSSLRLLALSALAVLSSASSRPAQAQNVHFVPVAYKVDPIDGTSTTTVLNSPSAVAADVFGNIYVSDTSNRVVRKVSPTQTATIFAGNFGFGYTGDGGPANAAQITYPGAIATDLTGNVYFVDTYNYVVRKVTPAGIISTFAGNGTLGSTGDGGLATLAQIGPSALATDYLGNVYIADYNNSTVRVVDTTGKINTFAGGGVLTGAAAENVAANLVALTPGAIATNAAGTLFITNGATIVQVNTSGIISTFAGNGSFVNSGDGGQALNAGLYFPGSLTVDSAGNVYLSDYSAKTVRRIDTSGIITTFAGYGFAAQTFDGIAPNQLTMGGPSGLGADASGNVFIAVATQDAVYRIVTHPEIFPLTAVGMTSPPQRLLVQSSTLNNVSFSSVAVTGDFKLVNNPLFSDSSGCQSNTILAQYHTYCSLDIAFTPTAEGVRSFPVTITSDDTPSTLTENVTSTGLGSALAMSSGQMYIVAGNNKQIAPQGDGNGGSALLAALNDPQGLAVNSAGDIFITEYPWCQIRKIDGNTGIISLYAGRVNGQCVTQSRVGLDGDGGPAIDALMNGAGALTFDPAGNLYISDTWDSRVRVIGTNGIINTIAGNGSSSGNGPACSYGGDGGLGSQASLCNPGGLATDSSGNLYIADTGNNVIRKVSASGIITTVAGKQNLGAGFSGDGGLATSAQLNTPTGVTVSIAGDIFIADSYNDVIRKVSAATGLISTIAGSHGVQGYGGDGGQSTGSKLYLPEGMGIDAAGDVFFADSYNMVIRKIDTSGIITTVAGTNLVYDGFNGSGLPATSTWLSFPNAVYVGSSGFIYISDASNGVIREMSPNGSLLFPPTGVGSTSSPLSVTVSNIGNMPLHFDSQFPTGVTGDFALAGGGTCNFNAVVAVGGSCSVNLTFSPTVQGTRNGIFGFFDNGVASPQYVALQGNGVVRKPQNISRFAPIPDMTYGDPPYTLAVATSSGLPVTFSVISGNASVTLNGNDIDIRGIGPVTIAADQAGDATWLPAAQVQKSFYINPAELDARAQTASSQSGQPLAPLTYTITGYAYSDNSSVVTGKPVLSTTATSSSPANTYPINIVQGTMASPNYFIDVIPSTYTVTPAPITGPPAKPTVIMTAAMSITKVGGNYQIKFTIENGGTAAAPSVTITSIKLNNVSASGVPKVVGTVAANGGNYTSQVTVPGSAGASGAAGIESISGTYAGVAGSFSAGTFGGTIHVTLP